MKFLRKTFKSQSRNTANRIFLLLSAWPYWKLDIRTWPRVYEDVLTYRNEASGSRLSKFIVQTGQTHTDTQTDVNECIIMSHLQTVNIIPFISDYFRAHFWNTKCSPLCAQYIRHTRADHCSSYI